MTYTLKQLDEKKDKFGNLDLYGCTSLTSLPDNITANYLYLRGCTGLTSLPDNLTANCLYLSGCTSLTPLPDNITTNTLNLSGCTSLTSLPDNITANYLNLRGCTGLTSLPDNLTANILYLRGCTSLTSLPDNLTANYLYLSGCTGLTSLPDNLTANYLDLRGCTGLTGPRKSRTLSNGDYVPGRYLYADGILTHVKRTKQIGKYTYYVGKIKGYNVIYDGVNYAHCKDFVSGVSDLTFKAAKDRGAEQYKGLTKDSVVSFEDGRVMYRVITGACEAGTQQFIDGMGEIKDSYTIGEIIEMTKNAYGGEIFRKFFDVG